ncbi:MAG TPA: hypothetical protein VGS05_18660 [Candidatus Sulfotelmatobacter sp.]|nr:hypothetical protein [Candidatus Sulfotelmatobacter sp.]
MFGEVKPFDWLMFGIEAIALLLIAYEVFYSVYERRKTRERNIEIGERKKQLFSLIAKGQAILHHAPSVGQFTEVDHWGKSVDEWTATVEKQLTEYSSEAAISFAQVVVASTPIPHIAPGADWHYRALRARLENLRNITEKAEVYY